MTRPQRLVLALVIGGGIGLLLAFLIRPVVLGLVVGCVLLVRIADLSNWRTGAAWSAVIGFIIGCLTFGRVVVNGADIVTSLLLGSISALIGALTGGITSRLRSQRKMRFLEH